MPNVNLPPLTIDSLHAELDVVSKRALDAESALEAVRVTWNKWKFIDKEDNEGFSHVVFAKEDVIHLLRLLRP